MSVAIRLQRQGSKKRPVYNIVAISKSRKRNGLYLEHLGRYFPAVVDPAKKITVNRDALNAWVNKGAQVSQTVGQLLAKASK